MTYVLLNRKPKGFQKELFPLETMESNSMKLIKENEPKEGYFLGFSGGKDSIVLEYLFQKAEVKYYPWYSCTRIDPPEVYRFIKINYPYVKKCFSKKSFWKMIHTNAPPTIKQKWCCKELKEKPSFVAAPKLKIRAMGLRSEESYRRSKRKKIMEEYVKYPGYFVFKPIFHWQEWHIWNYIEKYNLKYPSLYDEGFHRIGCVICPYNLGKSKKAIIKNSQRRWKGIWKIHKKVCKKWYDEKRKDKSLEFDKWYSEYLSGFQK